MKQSLFTVYDNKAQIFMNPFTAQTTAVAIRQFIAAASNPEHDFAKHPDDYMLICLGSFCPETATIEPLPAPNQLGLASQYIDERPEMKAVHNG